MSEKIEFEVTEGMRLAAAVEVRRVLDTDSADDDNRPLELMIGDEALTAALAHPSFQSQLRAYVAGEARRLVAGPYMYHHKMNELQERYAQGFDRCRELTLANIAAYEKEQEDDVES